MVDYQSIIDVFFPVEANPELREILLSHSRSVADMAVEVCRRHPELHADEDFVFSAAMLHDIGIVRCDAPGISCHGTEPYICHGVIGAQMLRDLASAEGLSSLCGHPTEDFARVCERHTGTGLTAEAIRRQHLPLPERDLQPETIEEQIVCYADKFFSKTRLDARKTFEQAEHSLVKFGEDGLIIFQGWHNRFGA